MKLRIQDNSIRFRLTIKETETLASDNRLECRTEIPGSTGTIAIFSYALSLDEQISESEIRLEPMRIEFALCPADAQALFDPAREGVYIRRESTDSTGTLRRFIAFVEKDRPGSTCIKPEAWIYETAAGQPISTVPIVKFK